MIRGMSAFVRTRTVRETTTQNGAGTMGSTDVIILISLIIVLTLYTLAFGPLLQRAVRMRRGDGLAIAGIALCFAMLIATAWNAGAMVPPPTSAGAAALLLALVESTATWRHRDRDEARDSVPSPINEQPPRALPYAGAASQGRFLPTP